MLGLKKGAGRLVLVMAIAAIPGWAVQYGKAAPFEPESEAGSPMDGQHQPTYRGKDLSHWLRSLRDRDEEMDIALDAIRSLGPDAHQAVPELTRIVEEPFAPIRIGVDGHDVILAKLDAIQLRAAAVDALAAIGEAAAPATMALIQWALKVRVIPDSSGKSIDEKWFIDLAVIDVLERMRVAGAIAQMGPEGSIWPLAGLLTSSDGEGRKLAVAVLNENALPVAAMLLKSTDCEDRKLGAAILVDMWPVVPREHLVELKRVVLCAGD